MHHRRETAGEGIFKIISFTDNPPPTEPPLTAEKEIFKKKMAEIDEADAGVDEESPPPTPTPV